MQMTENILETRVTFRSASTWPSSSPQEPAGKGLILRGVGTWVTGRKKEHSLCCAHARACTSVLPCAPLATVPALPALFQ